MDAEKFYRLADEALLEKTAYAQSIAQSAALISIAISLHRRAEGSAPANIDLRILNPLLRKIARLDAEGGSLDFTLSEVAAARQLLGEPQ